MKAAPSSFGSFLLCVEGGEPARIDAVTAQEVAGDITLDAAGVQAVSDGVGEAGPLTGGGPFALGPQYEPAAGARVDADCDSTGDRVELTLQASRGDGAGAVRSVIVAYSVGRKKYKLRIPTSVMLCMKETVAADQLPECM